MQQNELSRLQGYAKSENHPAVTLLGLKLAYPGCEYIQGSPGEECLRCKMLNFCYNLPAGRRFRVRSVRESRHNCAIHDEGKVQAVEVEPAGFYAGVEAGFAIPGSTLTLEDPGCRKVDCPNFSLCHFHDLVTGIKYIVEDVQGDLVCPLGWKRKRVRLVYAQ